MKMLYLTSMKAIWKGQTIAEAPKEDIIYIEGKWYFPPASVRKEFLRKSPTPCSCFWRGVCQYFDVGKAKNWSKDNAWAYADPPARAIKQVKQDFSNYVAFGQEVSVTEN
jgi:uncharacterized protein (DUF427 family)